MNEDRIKGNWKQLKGNVKERWGRLTDDDLDRMDGQRQQLVGKIQERYGLAKEKAEEQLRDWEQEQDLMVGEKGTTTERTPRV